MNLPLPVSGYPAEPSGARAIGAVSPWARLLNIALTLVMAVGAAIFLLPLAWMIVTALKTPAEIYVSPPTILPAVARWRNFAVAWTALNFTRYTVNTIVITLISTAGVLISASLCAFGFARLRFAGRNVIFFCVLASIMLPSQVTLVPLYIVYKHLGWLDSFKPLTIPAWFGGGAVNIFILRQSFLGLPRELDEAARIDGCTSFDVFYRIAVPLIKPALAVVAILHIQHNWTDFLGPLIYLNSPDKFTLALGLFSLQSEVMHGVPHEELLMAVAVLMVAPIAIIFLLTQRLMARNAVLSGLNV